MAVKKKKVASKVKKPHRWRRRILIGAAVFAAAACGLFVYVDQKVARKLQPEIAGELPAIYSDPFRISKDLGLPPSLLKEQLAFRAYQEVPRAPSKPGEFSASGATLTILTRGFTLPNGSVSESRRLEYPLKDDQESFYLEPRVIAPLGSGEQRATQYKKLSEIPKIMQQAVTAIEDQRFYEHSGIDINGIMRAMFANLRAMSLVQGGSTLTQQLAKNRLFTPRRTLTRKVLEATAALSIERRFTKEQILEMYLNEVYLGQEGAVALHGVAEASQSFFGKALKDITISEAAMLAGIIRAPSYYSPRNHFKRAHERMKTVLEKLAELGVINEQEKRKADSAKVTVRKEIRYKRTAPFFISALRSVLEDRLGGDTDVLTEGKVFTGLSVEMQDCAERAVTTGLQKIEKNYPSLVRAQDKLEGGLVAIEPYSGLVRAWVGGRDFSENQFDHAFQATRQIGSTIKPFLYLTALDSSLNNYKTATPLSLLADEPMRIDLDNKDAWEPQNYDKRFRGDVTLRYALENSLNLPAVYLAQKVGINFLATTIERFALGEKVLPVPALALGAIDTTLLKLTAAYAALANRGDYVAPRLFTTIVDGGGDVLLHENVQETHIADENAVYVLSNILQGAVERGTGKVVRSMGYSRVVAGKTGTTNEARDAWFVGFSSTLAAGVWVGFDNNDKIGLTGGVAAAPIWTEFMKCVDPYHETIPFIQPDGVVVATVDGETGQLATTDCPREAVIREVFVAGTEPTRTCSLHRGSASDPLDRHNGPRKGEPARRRKKSFWDFLFS